MTDRLPTPATVEQAVAELRDCFGELTRKQAASRLPLWRHYRQLSEADVAEVLDWFPVAAPASSHPLAPPGGHETWCRGGHDGECTPAGAV
jgi:hypothetical protein